MESSLLVSVIVITYHRNQFLQATLASIFRQEGLRGPFEIIVIDNGGDATIPPSPRAEITVHVVRPEHNRGVTGGRNLGITLAKGSHLIFIDDDAVWHDNQDMARIVARLESTPRCGCVAARILNPRTGETDRKMLPMPDKSRLEHSTVPVETPYFYGCAHAIRSEAVERVGMYPERLVYGMEELDLSLRLLDAGYVIVYDPDIAALHYEASSGRTYVGASYWKQHAINKSRVAWRLLPLPYPLTVGLIWSAAALVKTRRPGVALEIWQTLWRERTALRAERKVIASATVRYLKHVGARLLY